VWVGSQGSDQIYRIDPETNAVTPITIGKGGSVCVDPHDDGVWVSNEVAGSVSKLDPKTDRVLGTVKAGSAPEACAGRTGSSGSRIRTARSR
jgi:YVTN family beta-propeller protein